jgi:RNA polymerase sigma-70 factor (ECF subfamily)
MDLDLVMAAVYDHLRLLARRMHAERGAQPSVRPTSLVHEAYERLARQPALWRSQGHFAATAARAMRQILADRARRRGADKRGGGWERVTLSGVGEPDRQIDLFELDQALTELARMAPRACDVVQLRFFGGMTSEEIADVLEVNVRTVERDWRAARAWMASRLER